ncbi:hypothetical protein [Porphyrobacter sp. AAP60]|uniref:hypothetical protein n=1 Tax=Porphyrobacter sp. AAP60 TaxID=1523423 RepID=UPI0006B93E97|nr:hypothetical protein [Porphyrobacter sp. AAP60]
MCDKDFIGQTLIEASGNVEHTDIAAPEAQPRQGVKRFSFEENPMSVMLFGSEDIRGWGGRIPSQE